MTGDALTRWKVLGATPREQPLSAARRMYDARWRAYRRQFLARYPLCVDCTKAGRYTLATHVDHIVPHRGDEVRFWDATNHQPLCRHCHAVKTGRGL